MLTRNSLADVDGMAVMDVRCRSARGPWSDPETGTGHGIVFVRRGTFRRRVNGVDELVDPTTAYFERPHDEQQIAHPLDGGDACTAIVLRPEVVAAMWGGQPELPTAPVPVDPSLDLQHRLLVGACRRSETERFEVAERVFLLAAAALGAAGPSRLASGRPSTVAARQRVVDGAREALVADPTMGLAQLAGALNVSPHHLSRIFRAATGHSIARHRMRLRARTALERLAGGDRDLARLAADLGFADQSHLCRVIRAETGRTPSALRHALAQGV